MTGTGTNHNNEPFPRHHGRYKTPKRTDAGCCAMFLGYVGLMVAMVVLGFYYGKPGRLEHGVDFAGQVCGVDASVASNKFAYWCGMTENWNGDFPTALNDDSIVCLPSCPTDGTTQVQCLLPAIKNFTGVPGGTLPDGNSNVETLYMQVSQTIANQKSYPTEPFAGKFCLPSEANMALREALIKGPWAAKFRFYAMVSSVESTGLIVLISCVLALLLGFGYLYLLRNCAGPVMFGTMVFSTFCCLTVGFMFVWAIFVGDDNGDSFYCEMNPFYRTYATEEARFYSISLGVAILLFGSCLGCMTQRSLTHIDEMIGIVAATCECLSDTTFFFFWPLWQTTIYFSFWLLFLFIGFPYVASYGILDTNQIVINDNSYMGLEARFARKDWQWWLIIMYVFGCIWCIEVYIQFGHYVVSYCVACWYFTPVKEGKKKSPSNELKEKGEKAGLPLTPDAVKGQDTFLGVPQELKNVRVAGVDANFGERPAMKVKTTAGEFIMVNVQKKGPGLGRNEVQTSNMIKDMSKPYKSYPISHACWECTTMRIGSLAVGAFPIFFFRPFRIFADCVSAQLSRQGENPLPGGMSESRKMEVAGCCKIFTQFLDQAVGKYNKMAYMQQVLEGGLSQVEEHHHGAKDPECCPVELCCCGGGHGEHGEHGHEEGEHEHHHGKAGFMAAADMAFEQIVKAGGSLSYLHGALFIYEAFGTLAITLCCSVISLMLLNSIDMFNAADSEFFVEDKMTATILAGLSAGCVGFSCMSTFNHSADCILYCVGWNRNQLHFMKAKGIKEWKDMVLDKFIPESLRYLVPAYERTSDFNDPLPTTEDSTRQIDALFAAMQSGVQSMRTGAPMQYGAQYGPGSSQAHGDMSTGMVDHMGGAFGDHMAGLASGRY
mmetsp:Transcript_99084/g.171768  ORF Transcript_99084/g.171768 Transcript_99084/m.171768 type:complete len:886 (+) Transcript_99084:90-2747(+)